jgi:hypothetical protein
MTDLVGQKFGRLTIISEGIPILEVSGKKTIQRKTLLCLCDCGVQKEIRIKHILKGLVKSCGCLRQSNNMESSRKSITNQIGKKYGLLTVIDKGISITEKNNDKAKTLLCLCDCGTQKSVRWKEIISGKIKSCGCLIRITSAETARLSSAKCVFNKYKDGNLRFDDFLILSQQNCQYCDEPPSNRANHFISKSKRSSEFARENGYFVYNGLDRVNSSLPHNMDNVVPCCRWCNYAKRERSVEDFLAWAKRLGNKIIQG